MGLLDDLRKQTDNQKAKEQQDRERLERLQAHYLQELQPKMIEIYKYLNELAEHLNYINTDIHVPYQLNAEGLKVPLKQHNYGIRVDSTYDTKLVNFRFECSAEKDVAFVAGDNHSIAKNIEYLQRYNLQYQCKRNKDENFNTTNAQFTVKCAVPVLFVFQGNVENSSIDMTFTNFEVLGSSKHSFKAHHFNEKFFDDLGRFILHENPEFLKLNISDDALEQIRAQVAAEHHQRLEELKQAEDVDAQDKQQPDAARFRLFKKAE